MLQSDWYKITRRHCVIFASFRTSYCGYNIVCTKAQSRSPPPVFPFLYMHELILSSISNATYYIITQQACHWFGSNKATGCVWPKPAGILPVADRNHNLSPPPTVTVVQCSSALLSPPLLTVAFINPSYNLYCTSSTTLLSNPPSVLSP